MRDLSRILLIAITSMLFAALAFLSIMNNVDHMSSGNTVILPSPAWIPEADEDKRWDPTADDAAAASAILASCYPQGIDGKFIDDYFLQIAGVINDENEREIFVIAFHESVADSFPDWKTKPVIVDDGGSDFFEVTVNLTTNACRDLYVHGEA